MPQLDFATYAPQLVWLAITFILLYLVMWKIALPRVTDVLENRSERVVNDLDRAERLKREAEEAQQAYEAALDEARGEAHRLSIEAGNRVKADAARRLAALDGDLAGRAREADARITVEKKAALATIGEAAAEATQAAVRKLLGIEVDGEAVAAAIAGEEGRSS